MEFEALVQLASTTEALWKTVLTCGEQFPRGETFDFDAHFELQQVMPECIKVIDQLFGKFAMSSWSWLVKKSAVMQVLTSQ